MLYVYAMNAFASSRTLGIFVSTQRILSGALLHMFEEQLHDSLATLSVSVVHGNGPPAVLRQKKNEKKRKENKLTPPCHTINCRQKQMQMLL
jgi:hypothetical protein